MGHHSVLRGEAIDREMDGVTRRVDDILDVVRRGLKAGVNDPGELGLLACDEILGWRPAARPKHVVVTMRAALAHLCQEGVARMMRTDEWGWVGGE